MKEFNDDEKSFLADMIKSEGWRLFTAYNTDIIQHYRILATQPPGAVDEQLRTWYAALAQGREESINDITLKITQTL